MKRNLKLILKYILLISFTICITSILFYFTRLLQGNNNSILPINDNLDLTTTTGHMNNNYQKIDWHDHVNDKFQKIDWHDHYQIEMDKIRTGVGEQGKPAKLPEDRNLTVEKYLFSVNGFDGMLSDIIALNRSVPDIRHPGCKSKKYSRILPTVSVVVPFHNEHMSTLLRTVYSVLNRSPPQLLMEIILVDDFSSKAHTKKELDDYVNVHFTKVRVLHLTSRQGLIRARLAGARNATGDVLLFLDSHTEANVNWLPPLLEPIAEDYRTCVCPFIDVVAYDTFEYRAQDEGARGAFDWEFYYKRLPLLPEDKERPTEPFKSPVMAGGLFAISSKFFWELGGYDPGLDIWGGEQYELSFKIWLCGGRMFDAPCSRVGHIYRKFAPFPNPGIGDFIAKNYRRVAEVWMDEYAEYIYKRRPHYRNVDPGNLDKQFEIKNKLKCKPFKWFMENVAFDLVKVYPPVEPPDLADGKIKNFINQNYCAVVVDENKPIELRICDSDAQDKEFKLTWHKDIRVKTKATKCLDVASPGKRAEITLYSCHGMQGNQLWKYNSEKKWLVHGGNPRCLDYDAKNTSLFVSQCDTNSDSQKWIWDNINTELLKNQ